MEDRDMTTLTGHETLATRAREITSDPRIQARDKGDGGIGIIVRQALADDPEATVEDVLAIIIEAEEDARGEAARG
jgi:predicted regulator of amino acid metabolism with ACT domain